MPFLFDETKLPKWAQAEFNSLRYRITELERRLAIATREAPTNGATGKVMADDLGKEGFPLHDRAQVVFNLGKNKRIGCMLRERNGEAVLDVNSHWGALVIMPSGGNCAYLKVGDI